MKRTIMKYSIMFSLLLLTSCDISNEEIEQKAQSYTKSEYGMVVKLNGVETLDNGKDFLGPKGRIVTVRQVDEPHLQFQLYFEGQISPEVNNDNYEKKRKQIIYKEDLIHIMERKTLYLLLIKCRLGIMFPIRILRNK